MKKKFVFSIILPIIMFGVILGVYFMIDPHNLFERNSYQGKTVSWYGDSLTQQYAYCEGVNQYFGFHGKNCGISDTTVYYLGGDSLCEITRMAGGNEYDINPESDYIFVMAGVNDWMNDIPIGNVEESIQKAKQDEFSTEDFSSSVNYMFCNLKKTFPNATIIVLGTPYANGKHYKRFLETDGDLNHLGLSSLDYSDAFCEIATAWGIRNMNIGRVLGWNAENIYEKSPDGIHFSEEIGRGEVANAIIDFLQK